MRSMKRLYISLLAVSLLSACAGALVQSTPLPAAAGARGFTIYTVYGGVDGTRSAASAVLDKEAARVCGGRFRTVSEQHIERRTAWGAKNGQVDYHREVHCG